MTEHGCYDCKGRRCNGCDILHHTPTHWDERETSDRWIQESYAMLAAAIIKKAVDDYNQARRDRDRYPHDFDAAMTIAGVEQFFLTHDFSALTDMDGAEMLSVVKRQEYRKRHRKEPLHDCKRIFEGNKKGHH